MPAGYNCSTAENRGGGGAQDRRYEGVLLWKTPRLPALAGPSQSPCLLPSLGHVFSFLESPSAGQSPHSHFILCS